MTEVVLFHHALGRTDGVLAFAEELRRGGHRVHTPDLFDGLVFGDLDRGVAHAEDLGMPAVIDHAAESAEGLPGQVVYA